MRHRTRYDCCSASGDDPTCAGEAAQVRGSRGFSDPELASTGLVRRGPSLGVVDEDSARPQAHGMAPRHDGGKHVTRSAARVDRNIGRLFA